MTVKTEVYKHWTVYEVGNPESLGSLWLESMEDWLEANGEEGKDYEVKVTYSIENILED